MDAHMITQGAQAVAAFAVVGTGLGMVLGVAARYLSAPVDDRTEAVVALLPGSNCAQCGYAGCRQAAAAIADGRASPSVCPPGGVSTAQRVADLLGVRLTEEETEAAVPTVAWVDEARCIGCTRCIRKCSSDAIVGAAKQMHTVLPEVCFACGLCKAECPTDAIVMKPVMPTLATWHWPKPAAKQPVVVG